MAHTHFARYVAEGEEFTRYVPSVSVPAGTPVQLDPETWGVSAIDVPVGQAGEFRTRGIFRGVKENQNELLTRGDLLDFIPTLGFRAGTDRFKVIDTSQPGDFFVTVEINPVGVGGGGPGTLPFYLLKDRGIFDQANYLPAITDDSTLQGDYYHVLAQGVEQTIDFGPLGTPNVIVFPASTGGELVRDGSILRFYPYASPLVTSGGKFSIVATVGNLPLTPVDGEKAFVNSNRLTYIYDDVSDQWYVEDLHITATLVQFSGLTEVVDGQTVFVPNTDSSYEWDPSNGWKQLYGGVSSAGGGGGGPVVLNTWYWPSDDPVDWPSGVNVDLP